jgi:hypothetical protein
MHQDNPLDRRLSRPNLRHPPSRSRHRRGAVYSVPTFPEDLVRRRTALSNWVNRYLAHETWADRTGLWSAADRRRLRTLLPELPASDAGVPAAKLDEKGRQRTRRGVSPWKPNAPFVGAPTGRQRSTPLCDATVAPLGLRPFFPSQFQGLTALAINCRPFEAPETSRVP